MSSSSPVEFRHYMRLCTMQDIKNGVNPLRLTGPDQAPQLYCPPQLQFRYKERDQQGVTWTEWADVPLVREGDDSILATMDVPAGYRGS